MFRSSRALVSALAVACAMAALGLSAPRPDRAPAHGPVRAPAPRVVLEALDGTVSERALDGFGASGPSAVGAVLVRFEGVAPWTGSRAEGEPAALELASGDRLNGRIVGGSDEQLTVEIAGGVRLPVAIDDLARLVVPGRVPPDADLEPAPEGDRLYRRTGTSVDRIDGAIEGFESEGVRFDSVLGSKVFPWTEIAALFVAQLGEDRKRTAGKGEPVVVDLIDGSRLRGGCQKIDSSDCWLLVGRSTEVRLPLGTVAEIAVDDGSIAFLSELPVARAEEGSPFDDDLGMTWPHRIDRAVDGGPLRAGGRRYTRGIGVHAPSRLVWELGGAWRQLRGSCAIDDVVSRLPGRGSVVFRIHVDGELRWESGVVRGGDASIALPEQSLAGANELVLEVDMASDFHVADRADWLRVLLVK